MQLELCRNMLLKNFSSRSVLFRQGDEDNCFFVVVRGQVRAQWATPDGSLDSNTYKSPILGTLGIQKSRPTRFDDLNLLLGGYFLPSRPYTAFVKDHCLYVL